MFKKADNFVTSGNSLAATIPRRSINEFVLSLNPLYLKPVLSKYFSIDYLLQLNPAVTPFL
jgi:hypothetical protein